MGPLQDSPWGPGMGRGGPELGKGLMLTDCTPNSWID